jgi:ribonuclease HI
MNVTILTDASHCPDLKVAGYGFWIASERGKLPGSGAMKNLVRTSTLAEMQAVVNALWKGAKAGLIQKGDELLIQIDCEAAIYAFRHKRNVADDEKQVVEQLYLILTTLDLKCKFRHVKAHTGSEAARSRANDACDKRARKAMRRARIKLKIQQAREILNETVS